MGPDYIHNLFIKNGKNLLVPALTKIFNLCLKYRKWGLLWRFANYCPMPKPGKDATQTKNLRALQITSVIGRIFERVLANRLVSYMKCHGYLNFWNIAYQANKSIDDIITDLTEDIWQTFELKSELKCIFFDLSKAFDTVWIEGLLYKLNKFYGIFGNFFGLLKDFLKGRFNRVVLGDVYTEWKWHDIGVPQGGPLSALLFIIYINDFINSLKTKFNAYSDDASNRQKPALPSIERDRELKLEINKYYQFCQNWKLCINYDKCEYMLITNKKSISTRRMSINGVTMGSILPKIKKKHKHTNIFELEMDEINEINKNIDKCNKNNEIIGIEDININKFDDIIDDEPIIILSNIDVKNGNNNNNNV